jgi:hypothetical protein
MNTLRPIQNSLGQPIHPTAEGVKAFWKWFGDSKMVDNQGRPLVMYHGTPDKAFDRFKSQKEQLHIGRDTHVHWFAASYTAAKSYADARRAFDYQAATPGVVAAYLKIENPLEINGEGKKWRDVQQRGRTSSIIDIAHTQDNDGVIIYNVKDNYQTGVVRGDKPTTTAAVFSPTQIKSIHNRGTFDPDDAVMSNPMTTHLPVNQYGNIDARYLPPELVHVPGKRLTVTCKAKGIPCAPAVVGFEKGYPIVYGVVVWKQDAPLLQSAIQQKKKLTPEQKRQRREKAQRCDTARFLEGIKATFPGMPDEEAQACAQHATEIGSGRVGRSSTADDPITAAVVAYARHNCTQYDQLFKYGGNREDNRAEIGTEIRNLLDKWRMPRSNPMTPELVIRKTPHGHTVYLTRGSKTIGSIFTAKSRQAAEDKVQRLYGNRPFALASRRNPAVQAIGRKPYLIRFRPHPGGRLLTGVRFAFNVDQARSSAREVLRRDYPRLLIDLVRRLTPEEEASVARGVTPR